MQDQMTADRMPKEAERQLMQLARRSADNTMTVASTGRPICPGGRRSEAN